MEQLQATACAFEALVYIIWRSIQQVFLCANIEIAKHEAERPHQASFIAANEEGTREGLQLWHEMLLHMVALLGSNCYKLDAICLERIWDVGPDLLSPDWAAPYMSVLHCSLGCDHHLILQHCPQQRQESVAEDTATDHAEIVYIVGHGGQEVLARCVGVESCAHTATLPPHGVKSTCTIAYRPRCNVLITVDATVDVIYLHRSSYHAVRNELTRPSVGLAVHVYAIQTWDKLRRCSCSDRVIVLKGTTTWVAARKKALRDLVSGHLHQCNIVGVSLI
jgi:hypothetical protein